MKPAFHNRPLLNQHLFRGGEVGAWYEFEPGQLSQTNDGLTPVTAGDDPVGFVLDKSPNGNTLSQATDTTRPLYKSAGGGRHYLRFDGANDYLFRTSALGLFAAGFSSMFFCMALPSGGTNRYINSEGNSASANGYCGTKSSSPTSTTLDVASTNDAGTSQATNGFTSAFATTVRVLGVVDDGATRTAYINGVPSAPIAYTRSGVTTLNRFAIGTLIRSTVAGFPLMNLYGWIGVGRVLTAKEIAGVTRNLARVGGASLA